MQTKYKLQSRPKVSCITNLFLLLTSCIFLCANCGYHVSQSMTNKKESTISIPYVEGDSDGSLTSCIVEKIQQQGRFRYIHDGGEYILKVKILDKESENIGFRHDLKHYAQKVKRVIPNEERLKRLVEVSILRGASEEVVFGPVHIMGSCDFDHENYSPNKNINTFSLGQLSDIDTTYEVVKTPLNRDIASKVAQILDNHFDKQSLQ